VEVVLARAVQMRIAARLAALATFITRCEKTNSWHEGLLSGEHAGPKGGHIALNKPPKLYENREGLRAVGGGYITVQPKATTSFAAKKEWLLQLNQCSRHQVHIFTSICGGSYAQRVQSLNSPAAQS
jgi:hypothetical protein